MDSETMKVLVIGLRLRYSDSIRVSDAKDGEVNGTQVGSSGRTVVV